MVAHMFFLSFFLVSVFAALVGNVQNLRYAEMGYVKDEQTRDQDRMQANSRQEETHSSKKKVLIFKMHAIVMKCIQAERFLLFGVSHENDLVHPRPKRNEKKRKRKQRENDKATNRPHVRV